MSIGERIRYIRNLRGMTQKELGKAIGFDDRTADIRIAQYESGTRTPKANYVEAIAKALNVKTYALNVPETDTYLGLIHTLFALEDTYGIKINSKRNAPSQRGGRQELLRHVPCERQAHRHRAGV